MHKIRNSPQTWRKAPQFRKYNSTDPAKLNDRKISRPNNLGAEKMRGTTFRSSTDEIF